jgi:hypothetical protein
MPLAMGLLRRLSPGSMTGAGLNVNQCKQPGEKHAGEDLLIQLSTLETKAGTLEKDVRKALKERGEISS